MTSSNMQKTFWTKSLKFFATKKSRKSFSRQKVCVNCLQFQDSLEYFQTVLKFSRLSRNFPNHLENIQTIQKLSRSSGNFPDHLENIQTIWKLSRLFGNFSNYLENFLETFQIIWKSSRLSKDFPEGPEPSQCNFKGYVQKLSGRAKSFRLTMSRCHDGVYASDDCAWQNGSLIRSSSLLLKVFLPSPCYQDQPKP